jgi:hypothetical protein
MRELTEYRRNLINRLVAAAREFQAECLAVKDAFTPLVPGGWNTHQVAAHTRDVDKLVYGARVRRTAAEDNPEFESFDGETHMAQHYSTAEPLEEILNELVNQVESLVGMLRDLPPQIWARGSSHVMLGRSLTLQSWVEKDLAHIEEHLKTVGNRQKD